MQTIRKTLRVTCKAHSLANLDALIPFQENLKELDEEGANKLRRSLLKHGISFPFFIWNNNGANYILDGTQRERVLLMMRKEGWEIPMLPVDFVEAKNKKEAREKILLILSQYGKMNEDSFRDFLEESRLAFDKISAMISLPQINIPIFLSNGEVVPPEEFKEYTETIETEYECPKCGYEWSGKRTMKTEIPTERASRDQARKSVEAKGPITDCELQSLDHCKGFIEIHHKDGNPMNNDSKNLVNLCQTHHRLVENKKIDLDDPAMPEFHTDRSGKRRYRKTRSVK